MIQALAPLSRPQQEVFRKLRFAAQSAPLTVLYGKEGGGTSTLLQHLQRDVGGRFITAVDVMTAIGKRHPDAIEDALLHLFYDAFEDDDLILFDDFDKLPPALTNHEASHRSKLLYVVEEAVFDRGRDLGKRIVLGQHESASEGLWISKVLKSQAIQVQIPELVVEDFKDFLHNLLGEDACTRLDVEKLFYFARKLNGYQLQQLAGILRERGIAAPTLEQCLEVLERYLFVSNVQRREVEAISTEQLRGADALLEELERLVILPLQEPEIAQRLGLKPKRGVLLHGAPGTGKTSIGRILAHRMKGKFFMIDESSGIGGAYFGEIFIQAKASSPSIVFIDDADLLFRSAKAQGFTRYLLTELDGLESNSRGAVCLMMTAMDIRDIPTAILRSGRIEVWLDTKLPEYETRREILEFYTQNLAKSGRSTSGAIDINALAHHTEGFTPADLRRVVGDGAAFLAYDLKKERPIQPLDTYLAKSAHALSALKNTASQLTIS